MATDPRYWEGPSPRACGVCKGAIGKSFYIHDVGTGARWTLTVMDHACFVRFGRGEDQSRFTRYDRQEDGRWLRAGR